MTGSKTPAECPVCGARVPPAARACPECGADERSGWNEEQTRYDGLDLPEAAFADEAEAAPRHQATGSGAKVFWWIVAIAVVAAVASMLVLR